MAPNEVIKCAHPPCRCSVEIEEQYCSTACATEETQRVPCVCGHVECTHPEQALEDDDSESLVPDIP